MFKFIKISDLTRTCSWYIGIMEVQGGAKTINGIGYTFCNTDGYDGKKKFNFF